MKQKLTPAQALLKEGHPAEALKYLSENSADDYLRAICYRHLGHTQEAYEQVCKVLDANPEHYPAWNTFGMICTDRGEFPAAAEYFAISLKQAVEKHAARDAQADIQLNLANAYMRLEQFEKAWPLWEASRFGRSWSSQLVPWSGQPGKVVVICEGGYGDQILFYRWLAAARRKAGQDLAYYCFEELIPIIPKGDLLFLKHPRGRKISEEYIDVPWSGFDYATSIMSLPAICGMKSIVDIPPDVDWGYTRLPSHFQDGIGLCWNVEGLGDQRDSRSIPVEDFEPLAAPLKHDFVSLCPNREHPRWISDVALNTWEETCNVLCRLKCVITADTAVAHLAGALHVPTYVLLPLGSDWKWFTGLSVSPWYPSVRMIRNTDPVSWKPAIQLLTEALQEDGRM